MYVEFFIKITMAQVVIITACFALYLMFNYLTKKRK